MKIDRVKVTVELAALLVAGLFAVSLGALAPVATVSPEVTAAAGMLALFVARLLIGYVASLPTDAGKVDLQQVLGPLTKVSELAVAIEALSTTQKGEFALLATKLNTALEKTDQAVELASVPEPAPAPAVEAAPATGPPFPA